MIDDQLELEITYSDRNLNKIFAEYEDVLTKEPMDFIKKFMDSPFDTVKRPDLVDVHAELTRRKSKLQDVMFSMITFVLTKKDITLQAVVGKVFNTFECETFRRRTVLIEVLLHALSQCKYIRVERKGDYMYFQSRLPLNEDVTKQIDQQGFVLPMLKAPRVKSNRSIGYQTFDEHVISGGGIKEHDYEVCLDHLNRVNSTYYSYEPRLGLLTHPKFDPEPKVKDNGDYETADDVATREMSFNQLHLELPAKIKIMMQHGNRFNLIHKYDNRLRTYVKSYHFNYQGTKFLKAMVHCTYGEKSTGEW